MASEGASASRMKARSRPCSSHGLPRRGACRFSPRSLDAQRRGTNPTEGRNTNASRGAHQGDGAERGRRDAEPGAARADDGLQRGAREGGVMLAGDGLHPSSKGVRVEFSGSERKVIDGPFAETKELLAGYWVWQVKSMEEAIEWVKRIPNPEREEAVVEIRPVAVAEDFGEELTPELRERERGIERQLRAQTEEGA